MDWVGFLRDLALPKTDRMVTIQWIVMAIFWIGPLLWARGQDRDIRHFVWGLAMMNLAWFAFRAVH